MNKEHREHNFASFGERLSDEKAKEIASRIPGVQLDAETFFIPVHDEEGQWVADVHFMRHKDIPWEPTRSSLGVEDCLAATAKHGLEIHRGEMSLYDAVLMVRDSKKKEAA